MTILRKRKTTLEIMGKLWTIRLVSERWFDHNIEVDGGAEGHEGLMLPKEKCILLVKGNADHRTVVHEITHAYIDQLCTNASNIEIHDFEEIICDMVAEYGEVILSQAREVSTYFSL